MATTPVESDASSHFDRSDQPFFRNRATHETVVRLAQVRALVIYCGAGVTLDRTGLTWTNLVTTLLRRMFREEDDRETGARASDLTDADIDVLRDSLTPLQLASILGEVSEERAGGDKAALHSIAAQMQTLLYRHNGWQSGALVRNIIRLAVGCAMLGKRVVIVTTNYDDYLETEFDDYCREMKKTKRRRGDPTPSVPGVLVSALGEGRHLLKRSPAGAPGPVEIVHLHGRVASDGKATSRLSLTERDYHTSHGEITNKLKGLFSIRGAGVLILGASLTDPPLLAALSETNHQDSRVALMPATATRMTHTSPEQFRRLERTFKRRGEHFGVEFLMPDFHFQVAQFCEELLLAVGLDDPNSYLSTNIVYGQRLAAWWNRWTIVDAKRPRIATHQRLAHALGSIDTLIGNQGRGERGDDTELTKIELWVREEPPQRRRLGLFASTVGILEDRRVLRTEELLLSSGNASVRAFLEGRPQYVDQEALRDGSCSAFSRWRSFLSVPIRIGYASDARLVGLPVGVVTLATMRDKRTTRIPYRSTARMEEIVDILLSAGEGLLLA